MNQFQIEMFTRRPIQLFCVLLWLCSWTGVQVLHELSPHAEDEGGPHICYVCHFAHQPAPQTDEIDVEALAQPHAESTLLAFATAVEEPAPAVVPLSSIPRGPPV